MSTNKELLKIIVGYVHPNILLFLVYPQIRNAAFIDFSSFVIWSNFISFVLVQMPEQQPAAVKILIAILKKIYIYL